MPIFWSRQWGPPYRVGVTGRPGGCMEARKSFYARAGLGKLTKPAGKAFLSWLRSKGASPAVQAAFRSGILKTTAEQYPLVLYSELDIMEMNSPGRGNLGVGIERGLLIIGSAMANGDPVAIDLRDLAGQAGYINHETMWSASDVRDEFLSVASSLGEAADLIAKGMFPGDYYEAQRKPEVVPSCAKTFASVTPSVSRLHLACGIKPDVAIVVCKKVVRRNSRRFQGQLDVWYEAGCRNTGHWRGRGRGGADRRRAPRTGRQGAQAPVGPPGEIGDRERHRLKTPERYSVQG